MFHALQNWIRSKKVLAWGPMDLSEPDPKTQTQSDKNQTLLEPDISSQTLIM
jgi:hypothetical protein